MKTGKQNKAMRFSIFLIAFLIASCSPVKRYAKLPDVIKWETEIAKFEALNQVETYPEEAVLFAGSSSIRRWESLAEDMSPYPVIQRGYGGAKLSDFAVFADRIIHPHNCSAIVLFIANDIVGKDSDKTPSEVLKLFISTMKTIRKKLPKTPVFWIAITPSPSRWEAWPRIKEANKLISNYCDKHPDLFFIATEDQFLNKEGSPRKALFVADNLHLSAEGYRLWTGIIKAELNKVLSE